MTEVISVLVIVFSLASKVSLADQVRVNTRRRSVEGLSIFFFATAMLSYSAYVAYGVVLHNWALVAAQGPGAVLTLAVGVQWLWWKK
jgi:hypothetical protein